MFGKIPLLRVKVVSNGTASSVRWEEKKKKGEARNGFTALNRMKGFPSNKPLKTRLMSWNASGKSGVTPIKVGLFSLSLCRYGSISIYFSGGKWDSAIYYFKSLCFVFVFAFAGWLHNLKYYCSYDVKYWLPSHYKYRLTDRMILCLCICFSFVYRNRVGEDDGMGEDTFYSSSV